MGGRTLHETTNIQLGSVYNSTIILLLLVLFVHSKRRRRLVKVDTRLGAGGLWVDERVAIGLECQRSTLESLASPELDDSPIQGKLGGVGRRAGLTREPSTTFHCNSTGS